MTQENKSHIAGFFERHHWSDYRKEVQPQVMLSLVRDKVNIGSATKKRRKKKL